METKRLWKTMLGGMKSGSGDLSPWVVGKWRKHEGELEMCHSGFHASENVIDAFGYVNPGMVCEVEVRGKHLAQDDKQVWSEMRVLRAWKWEKADSVALAVYAAELVIGIYEKQYPNDDRPRKAIEAAKAWLNDPSEKNRDAAWDAARAAWDAARAAWDAAGDAWAAAWAAWDAARAAWDAAGDAARASWNAAWDAAWDARNAAWEAARDAARAATKDILPKCHAFVMARCEAKGDGK